MTSTQILPPVEPTPAAQPAAFGDEKHILVPQMLLGAACCAIDKKRDGTKVLAELRRYTVGDLSAAAQEATPEHADIVTDAMDRYITDMKAAGMPDSRGRHVMAAVHDAVDLGYFAAHAKAPPVEHFSSMDYGGGPFNFQGEEAREPTTPRPGKYPESLFRAVNQWFDHNVGGGCSTDDVSDLAALFYGVTYGGGKESVDDALAVVESFGPGVQGLNDTFARQVLLGQEVRRLRTAYELACQGRSDFRNLYRAARGQAQAAPAEYMLIDWPLYNKDPLLELDDIYADYSKSFGITPGPVMAKIVQRHQARLQSWFGGHREAIRSALVDKARAQAAQPEGWAKP